MDFLYVLIGNLFLPTDILPLTCATKRNPDAEIESFTTFCVESVSPEGTIDKPTGQQSEGRGH